MKWAIKFVNNFSVGRVFSSTASYRSSTTKVPHPRLVFIYFQGLFLGWSSTNHVYLWSVLLSHNSFLKSWSSLNVPFESPRTFSPILMIFFHGLLFSRQIQTRGLANFIWPHSRNNSVTYPLSIFSISTINSSRRRIIKISVHKMSVSLPIDQDLIILKARWIWQTSMIPRYWITNYGRRFKQFYPISIWPVSKSAN